MAARKSLRSLRIRQFAFASTDVSALSAGPGTYIDTHCHIDKIIERMREPGLDFAQLKRAHIDPAGKSGMGVFAGAVHIACDPADFAAGEKLITTEPLVVGAFGVHPHRADRYTPAVEQSLVRLNSLPKAVAWYNCLSAHCLCVPVAPLYL